MNQSIINTVRRDGQMERIGKCCVCGNKFTQLAGTWSRVLPSGSEQRWHAECDKGSK